MDNLSPEILERKSLISVDIFAGFSRENYSREFSRIPVIEFKEFSRIFRKIVTRDRSIQVKDN